MRNKIYSWFGLFIILTTTFGLLPASAYGFYYDNPAEEAFTKTKFELLIPQVTLGAKNNLFNLDNLNIDLTDSATKEQFLNRMGGGIFKIDYNGQLKTGLTIGRFSLHLRPWSTGSFRLAPAIPELIFDGYGPDADQPERLYNLAETKANSFAAVSLDFKYGHPFRLTDDSELGVGITLRYVKGATMVDSEVVSGQLIVDQMGNPELNVVGRYTMVEPPDSREGELSFGEFFNRLPGSGFLADIGVTYARDQWRAGLALKNIGTITWKDVEQGTYTYHGKVTTGMDGPELDEDNFTEEVTVLSSYKTSLPIVLEAQGSYRFLGPFYCHLGVETGLSDGWGISSSPRIWTGLEWKPRHLIRMAGGVAYHDRHFNYNALLELKLLCFWANLKLDWMHDFGGANASAMFALHF